MHTREQRLSFGMCNNDPPWWKLEWNSLSCCNPIPTVYTITICIYIYESHHIMWCIYIYWYCALYSVHVQNHMVLIPTWYHRLFHTFPGLNGISLSIWLVRLRLVASFQLRECLTSTQVALRNKTFECGVDYKWAGGIFSTRHDFTYKAMRSTILNFLTPVRKQHRQQAWSEANGKTYLHLSG